MLSCNRLKEGFLSCSVGTLELCTLPVDEIFDGWPKSLITTTFNSTFDATSIRTGYRIVENGRFRLLSML